MKNKFNYRTEMGKKTQYDYDLDVDNTKLHCQSFKKMLKMFSEMISLLLLQAETAEDLSGRFCYYSPAATRALHNRDPV